MRKKLDSNEFLNFKALYFSFYFFFVDKMDCWLIKYSKKNNIILLLQQFNIIIRNHKYQLNKNYIAF